LTIRDRILVTGAGGFIGQRMVAWLVAAGYAPIAWTRADCDLGDQKCVELALRDLRPTRIFHNASRLAVAETDNWRGVSVDTVMLRNISMFMPTDCRLIHMGSMAEYGYSGTHSEDAFCQPRSAYGFAKHCSTNYALAARIVHGLDIRIARLFGVYGPGESSSRLFPFLVSRLLAGGDVELSDGLQVRDFVHVDDVCRMLWDFSDMPLSKAPLVNIGTGMGVSVRVVCEKVADYLGIAQKHLIFGAKSRRVVDEEMLVTQTGRLAGFSTVPTQWWLQDKGPALEYINYLAESSID
jgi:nucleoside-diphosphate-sugar epimerase